MKPFYNTLTILLGISLLLINNQLLAQTGATIKGVVKTNDGQAAPGVSVTIKELNKSTATNINGVFTFNNIKPGTYTIKTTSIGLKTQETLVTAAPNETATANFILTGTSEQLSEVTINSAKSINEKPLSSGKAAIKPLDNPQSTTVISSQVIQDQQVMRLSDAIKNVNGVSMGSTRGTASETFFARGYNLGANNILRNGSRVNSGVIPEASTLERVEVIKGSAAMLYGNVSSGAVINMVTKQPKFNYGGEVSMRAGSYDLYKPTADVYGPITQNLAFRIIGTFEDARSFRDGVKSNRTYVNPSLLYKLGAKTDILVQADYLKNNYTPDFGIGSLDGRIPTNIPRSSFFNTPWAFNNVDQTTASATVNHQLNDVWKLNVVGSYQAYNRNYFSTERIQANAAGDWSRALTRSKSNEDYYNGQVNLTGIAKTGNISHNLLIGTDADIYNNISYAFSPLATYDKINVLDPTKYTLRTDEPVANELSFTRTPTYRLGYYAQDLISLSEKFKVLAGLRWSYQKVALASIYDVNNGDRLPNTSATTSKSKIDKAFSPRLGLVFQPTTTTSVYANYSNNFVTNQGTDIFLQSLPASIIDQYEIGVKNDLLKNRLSVNFNVYKIINHNSFTIAALNQQGGPNSDTNLKESTGRTTSDGAEVDLSGNLTQGLYFMAGYSYNFIRYTKGTGQPGSYITGERLVSTPAHTANGSLFYTFTRSKLKGVKLGASAFYTGNRNAGWNNTVGQTQGPNRLIPVKGFTTVDLSAGYSFSKLSLLAKVSNLTNTLNYYVHENYSVNPIAPRQFLTTVAYRF
jgi:iron complex outermembrane receptor protein